MTEGINMGRKSPWTKEEYISIYNQVNEYRDNLATQLLAEEGVDSAVEAHQSYTIYKFPIVYLFIHYHFGSFNDLGMDSTEASLYLMFMSKIKYFAKELNKAYATGQVFINDIGNAMGSKLAKMCNEILYIEENF